VRDEMAKSAKRAKFKTLRGRARRQRAPITLVRSSNFGIYGIFGTFGIAADCYNVLLP
jgi:hypothetical protein